VRLSSHSPHRRGRTGLAPVPFREDRRLQTGSPGPHKLRIDFSHPAMTSRSRTYLGRELGPGVWRRPGIGACRKRLSPTRFGLNPRWYSFLAGVFVAFGVMRVVDSEAPTLLRVLVADEEQGRVAQVAEAVATLGHE